MAAPLSERSGDSSGVVKASTGQNSTKTSALKVFSLDVGPGNPQDPSPTGSPRVIALVSTSTSSADEICRDSARCGGLDHPSLGMQCDLWHIPSGNMIACFDSETEALAEVHGSCWQASRP